VLATILLCRFMRPISAHPLSSREGKVQLLVSALLSGKLFQPLNATRTSGGQCKKCTGVSLCLVGQTLVCGRPKACVW